MLLCFLSNVINFADKKQYLQIVYRFVQKKGHFLSDKCIDTMAPKTKKDQHDQA